MLYTQILVSHIKHIDYAPNAIILIAKLMGDRNSHAKPLRYEPWIDMAGTMSSPRTLFDALFEPRTQIFALHTTNFSIFEKSHIMSNQHHYPASQELYQQAKKLKKDAQADFVWSSGTLRAVQL